MGYTNTNIKFFNDVIPSSVVDIETVLTKCKYVFVYISKNVCLNKGRCFGRNACLIENALKKQKTNKKIKIVRGRELWDLPHNESLTVTHDSIFLDYTHYKTELSEDFLNITYKQNLKDLLESIHYA